MTPALQTQAAPRRAERPTVITRCTSPCQPQPFVVTTLRPLAVVACEALPAAHRLLADSAAAVQPAHGVLAHDDILLERGAPQAG